ncbi:DUF4369 domain-containing protein [Neptunitalea lumnitzerae]|nr:DUF4369 domain-containing protein [Neptunitalea sp. Y10]
MKKLITVIALAVLFGACSKDKNTMILEGNIEGLKLGTLYFQRMNDSTVVNIDTLNLDGTGKFKFEIPLEEPEVFFLHLDKKDENPFNDQLMVFGEPGTINVASTRQYFTVNAKITGSKNQEIYDEYIKTKSKFNRKNLDWLETKLKGAKKLSQQKIDSFDVLIDNNTKRSYLYSINFCINHKDAEVAPYIALTDLNNTGVKFLDTINNSLTDKVAASKYGKLLDKFIKDIKKAEQ